MSRNPPRRALPRALASLVLAATLASAARSTAQDAARVPWRTDLVAAQAEARRQGKPLLVVFHQFDESGNRQMLRDIYRDATFVRACERVVPVLACKFELRDGAKVAAEFQQPAQQLAQAEVAVRKMMFGSSVVLTPQHILLHPEGDVVWHNVRVCDLAHLLSGISSAQGTLKHSDSKRLRTAVRRAKELAKTATNTAEDYGQLEAMIRQSPTATATEIYAGIAKHAALCERLLVDTTTGLAPGAGRQRLGMATAYPAALRPAVERVRQGLEERDNRFAGREVEVLDGALPVLGQLDDLANARFSDAVLRTPATDEHELTLLWLFLPDDDDRERQFGVLRAAAAELQQEGVRVLGLGASIDPQKDLSAIDADDFPFPVGTFYYDYRRPFAGVEMFPAAVVLDRHGQIIYRTTSEQMAADYECFLPTVRGILQSGYHGE